MDNIGSNFLAKYYYKQIKSILIDLIFFFYFFKYVIFKIIQNNYILFIYNYI